MKGFTRSCKLSLTLLAAGLLVFGQTNTPQLPARAALSSPNPNTYPATYNAPAGSRRASTTLPGTINYLEGQVLLDSRPLGAPGSVVIQPGQILSTASGFAEVLLTPGAFLRVGHDSEIRLVSSGLADMRTQLERGTAMVEVDELIKGTNLAVVMNGATVQLEKKGLYEFDANQQVARVLDGKAKVTEPAGTKNIDKGDELQLASAKSLKTRSFDMKAIKSEPLYVWSEARSQDESRANVAVAQNVAVYGGWYGPGWYWDPYWSFYAFLPGSGFLYSPFGWGFYSPAFIGYYGVPFHYGVRYRGFHGPVGHVSTHVHAFSGGAFHAGAVGGFHGGGRR